MNQAQRDALAAAYDEHVWDVYGFFGYRVARREEAEDLTQATFERAARAWERFDPERGTVQTWLLAIARNLLIDHYRSGRAASERPLGEGGVDEAALGLVEPAPPPLGPSPELEAALEGLSDRAREVVALRFGGDLSGAQIAELTGLSLANVQQILSRALRALREELSGEPAVAGSRRASE